jgi:Amt family ammonium transporter
MLRIPFVLLTLVAGSLGDYRDPRNGPPQNCAATRAFNASAMGLDINAIDPSVYTCNLDTKLCWETHANFDTGDIAWMLFATTFVMLQTPATGFAQGGLVRRKNALSVIGQSFAGVILGCLQWYVWGYSLTFGPDEGSGFIGNPSTHAWFEGVEAYDCIPGQTIPHLLFAAFQMTFALMVPVLVTGAWAEKFSFFSAVQFMIIWPILVYYPTAHWIWGGGWLAANDRDEPRAVDYAGGIVIHTASGVASLVVAVMLQKRRAFRMGSDEYTSNLPLSLVGVSLVWVGWYSFNGGSGLRANGQAISALFVTQIAACTSSLTWCVCSYLDDGKVQITHLASGALAGLAGITPGSGYVTHLAGVPYGIIVGVSSFYGGKMLKDKLKLDDVLDVTSLQAIPGAVGSILVGFFADSRSQPCDNPDNVEFHGIQCNQPGTSHLDGVFYDGNGDLLKWQVVAVIVQILWTGVFTYVTMKIIESFNLLYRGEIFAFSLFSVNGLDVSPEAEAIGLDRAHHGEKAYDIDYADKEEDRVMGAALCHCAAKGNLKDLQAKIRLGADPFSVDVDGRTPLHLAARGNHLHVMEYLIEFCRVHVNQKDNFGSTPLKDAKYSGSIEAVEYLKKNGANDISNASEEEVLFRSAASRGTVDEVVKLVKLGVDVDAADYDGRTALHIASSEGHGNVVAELLKAGADCTVTDRFGSMPIHDAQRYKHQAIETMIREGADIDFDRIVMKTASTEGGGIAAHELLLASSAGDLVEVKRLRKKGVNMVTCDYDGRTALHTAAKNGQLDVVRYLTESVPGANINVQDSQRRTPLMEAMQSGHHHVESYLLGKGATLSDSVEDGAALCQAAFKGDLSTIKIIQNSGISLRSADYDGRTALHLAAAGGHVNVLEYLLNPGPGIDGIDVNTTDRWGGSALDDASRCGNKDAAMILRKLGADDIVHAAATTQIRHLTPASETESMVQITVEGGTSIQAQENNADSKTSTV